MGTVYIFLADGFEEIEALAPVDFLRRAGINVTTIGIAGKTVTGSHGITVLADEYNADFVLPQDAAMIVLPGGGDGTANLMESELVAKAIKAAREHDLYIAAICAAPTVLHKYGLLDGRTVTAFPSVQAQLSSSNVTGAAVEIDGKIITGRAAGVAWQFAHALTLVLASKDVADATLQQLYPEK